MKDYEQIISTLLARIAELEKVVISQAARIAELEKRMKCKQKISGGFRTSQGAEQFARIRGFISTVRKQGLRIISSIQSNKIKEYYAYLILGLPSG